MSSQLRYITQLQVAIFYLVQQASVLKLALFNKWSKGFIHQLMLLLLAVILAVTLAVTYVHSCYT